MSEKFELLLLFITIIIGFFITAFILIILGYMCINGIDSILDKSECIAFVENKEVYSGRCHFLNIYSVGENGNTKRLFICKDIWNLKPEKIYVNEDIKVIAK